MRRRTFVILGLFLLLATSSFAEEIVKLATTTSTYETGLLDYILSPFEKRYNVKIHIISVGTGKAIELGKNGDVDLILVHARGSEEKFINEGYGVNRRDVMYNDFVILGPKGDPAGVAGLKDVKDVLKRIADTGCTFVSRGDNSGTDKKEKYLWKKAGLNPSGTWYLEAGQGMGATLRIADEKNSYVMVDRATYLFNKANIQLKTVAQRDKDLFNPYSAIAINPDKYPYVKYELAMALIGWLVSSECQKMINEYKVGGNRLFVANAGN